MLDIESKYEHPLFVVFLSVLWSYA